MFTSVSTRLPRNCEPRSSIVKQAAIGPGHSGFKVPIFPLPQCSVSQLLPLQDADGAVGEVKPLGHYCDDITKESLAERGVLALHSLIGFSRQLVEYARRLGLNGRAAHAVRNEAHFSDRRVLAQAAHTHRSSFTQIDD